MDRETKRAYQLVQKTIVDNIDRLQALQKAKVKPPSADVNDLKKWRRFGAAFAWDPEVFQDVLEKPYMEPEELISRLRKTEEGLMRKFQYVKGIPLHHIIADRTGGDLGIRTPIDIWLDTKKRIFDLTGATPGDNQANLNAIGAFDELWHQGRLGAKGTVFAEAGLIRPEDFPFLHRAGQNLADRLGLDPKLVQASSEEQVKALLPSILQQQERFAKTTATPQVQQQRSVFTQAGFGEIVDPTTPPETIQLIEKATRKTELPKLFAQAGSIRFSPQPGVEQFMASGAAALARDEVNKGLAKMGLPPLKGTQMFAIDPISAAVEGGVQAVRDAAEAVRKNVPRAFAGSVGAATAIEPEAVKSALEGDYREAAVQTAAGAVGGAAVEFGIKKATPVISQAAAKVLPKAAVSMVGGAAKFVPVLAGGYAGYQMLDAIVEGATGKNIQETGVAAVEKKEELRKQGYSEYELRRRARTGYRKP